MSELEIKYMDKGWEIGDTVQLVRYNFRGPICGYTENVIIDKVKIYAEGIQIKLQGDGKGYTAFITNDNQITEVTEIK